MASVRFWPDIQETIFPPLQVPEGKRRVVRCRCGINDWNEDGRWLGEYCCASCGQRRRELRASLRMACLLPLQ
ncbi:hypothetical protein D4N13_24425 [Escherichia coli]|uniref:Uncharacterized protein n=1 Tax=Escherichia coli TaxID=562 RepID=A0A8T9CMJ1_ECOLX|nr:hypothetical protein D4N13_24425 [Escherichia coli]TXU22035.1 hypothetical protein D4N09_29365 [Escherichia coli]